MLPSETHFDCQRAGVTKVHPRESGDSQIEDSVELAAQFVSPIRCSCRERIILILRVFASAQEAEAESSCGLTGGEIARNVSLNGFQGMQTTDDRCPQETSSFELVKLG